MSPADIFLTEPNKLEVLVAEGKKPDIVKYTHSSELGDVVTVQGIIIPPIPWNDLITRWHLPVGWAFYNREGDYLGNEEIIEMSAGQVENVKQRITNAEKRMARIAPLAERINQITAQNKVNPPELFG